MAKYRKRPVVIEAEQLTWQNWNRICEFVTDPYFGRGVYLNDKTLEILPDNVTSQTMGLIIKTLEGEHLARQNDWIIKGIKGEFYPCKPDIFEKTYEKIEDKSYFRKVTVKDIIKMVEYPIKQISGMRIFQSKKNS